MDFLNVALENLNSKNRRRPISAKIGGIFRGKSIPELQEEYKNYPKDSVTVSQTDDCVNIKVPERSQSPGSQQETDEF